MKNYLQFLYRCFRLSFVGDWRYHLSTGAGSHMVCRAIVGFDAVDPVRMVE